jgi:hypothetical protein
MMSNFMKLACASVVSAAFLSGCGGGGGDSSAVTPAVTLFALQAGYMAGAGRASAGTETISGSCSGLLTFSNTAASPATFEGTPALAVSGSSTITLTNCTPASNTSSSISYYDSNYTPLGHSYSSGTYGKFLTAPSSLPASVKVGDTAISGTETIYTDSTKSTVQGQRVRSYLIEADGTSTSTAIANLILKDFNASNQLLLTQQQRYRMATNGTLNYLNSDLQYSTTSSVHLIFTPK